MRRATIIAPVLLLSLAAAAQAEIGWRKEIRAALAEGEARGVPVFVFLSRDD